MEETVTTPKVLFPDTMDGLIDLYVKLRDRIAEADAAHKEKVKPAREMLEALNGQILARLNEFGGDSIKTRFGTAYRTEKKSATIQDAQMFRDFVIANQAWDIADWKANAPAVADFVQTEGALPPGVNYTTAYVVGVRRS